MTSRTGLFFGAAGLALLLASQTALADATVKLRVMETTDIHVHIVDYDYFRDAPSVTVGLARTAALIKAARAEATNSILVDNGDLIQGNPLGDYMAKQRGLKAGEVHPVYKAMNLLDYDAGNLGNHEFNYGLEFLGTSMGGANFPYVSANVFHEDGDGDPTNDKPYYQQYVMLDRTLTAEDGSTHPIKIGVVGFLPPQIMQWDKSNLEGTVNTRDIVDVARELVPEMKAAGADVVIAVPHSSLSVGEREGGDENASYWLAEVPDIDAIMFGHGHLVFPSAKYADQPGIDVAKGTINGVPATMPGFWGSHLGYVDLTLNVSDSGAWSATDGVGVVKPIYERDGRKRVPLVEPVPEIVAAVQEEHEATIAFVRTGVGEITAPINSFFALVQDDPSIQIVTDSQKRYVERLLKGTEYDGVPVLSAGAPFKAGGRGGPDYYTDVDTGEIALKHVADLYIYPNTLRAVTLTGAQVREWLEMSAGAFNQIDPNSSAEQALLNPDFPSYNFDVIDGVGYKIDLTQPARYDSKGNLVAPDSHRIVDLTYEGQPIDEDATFVVATNNYRASGGGNFPGMDGTNIIIEAPDTNRDVLANYIFDLKTIDPSADNNWSFASIDAEVNVTFTTSPSAEKALTDAMPISSVGPADEGFRKYRMRFDE